MTVLAIDPGSEQSAWVLWNGAVVQGHAKVANSALRDRLAESGFSADEVVIERIGSYGMVSGLHVFETAFWSGRFAEAAHQWFPVSRLYRHDVKMHICHSKGVNDSIIKRAVIDRFGGPDVAVGTKRVPGPLYGLKADEWQALALAVTWFDTHAAGD